MTNFKYFCIFKSLKEDLKIIQDCNNTEILKYFTTLFESF